MKRLLIFLFAAFTVSPADAQVTGSSGISASYLAPFSGSVARSYRDKASDIISVKDFGAKGDGSTADQAAFIAASAATRTVMVPHGKYRISANTMLDANLIVAGGTIYVDRGVTLAVRGTIIAPDTEIFDGLGAVNLDSSPNAYNLAWFKTTNGYINERWNFAKRGMAAWRSKTVRIPRPYQGQTGVLDNGAGRLFWQFSDAINIADAQNASTWFIEGEFYAHNATTNFLNFEDAAKPENIYFYGPLQAIAPPGTVVKNGINIKSGARIQFYGQVVLNGFQTPIKIGGSDQIAPVTDVRFLQVQASFFSSAAVYIYGKAKHTVQAINFDVLQSAAAQTAGLNAVEMRGLLRDIRIGDVFYATDTAKDGYKANDVQNVVYVESNAEGDMVHVEVGGIYQANANNGLKVTSTIRDATRIKYLIVDRIFGKFNGGGADVDYCQLCSLRAVENFSTVTLGANTAYVNVMATGGEKSLTDNGAKNTVNGLGFETRGRGVAPDPTDKWPVGAVIRETSDARLYRRIARGGTPADFMEIASAIYRGSVTYDPPSLSAGSGATTSVTVTGAAMGDAVAVSFSNDLRGITVTGWVSSANTVSVRFQNGTAGTIDLAGGTLRASVRKT